MRRPPSHWKRVWGAPLQKKFDVLIGEIKSEKGRITTV